MAFTLKIETGNAAFEDDQGFEVGRILNGLLERLEDVGASGASGTLLDYNGNTVGSWTLDAREAE